MPERQVNSSGSCGSPAVIVMVIKTLRRPREALRPVYKTATHNIIVHHFDTFVCEALMTEHEFSLMPEEQMMFERPHVVVTNRRLLAVEGRLKTKGDVEMPLKDVGTPKKFNGGQQDRRSAGVKALGLGLGIIALEVFAEPAIGLNDTIELVMFVVGALATVIGTYFLLASLLYVKPNTIVVFPVAEGDEVVVRFTEWDSPDADELILQFARAKRRL